MNFSKLKFEKITNDGQTQYFINSKEVTENVYNKLLSDESLYAPFTLPPLPKIDHSPENNIDGNDCSIDEEGLCEDCQQILDIVRDIKDMDEEDAFIGLRDYFDALEVRVRMQTTMELYEELGNNFNRLSARVENNLEDFVELYNEDEEDLD